MIITQNLEEECIRFGVQDDCPSASKKSCYTDGNVIEENQVEPSADTAEVEENRLDTINMKCAGLPYDIDVF